MVETPTDSAAEFLDNLVESDGLKELVSRAEQLRAENPQQKINDEKPRLDKDINFLDWRDDIDFYLQETPFKTFGLCLLPGVALSLMGYAIGGKELFAYNAFLSLPLTISNLLYLIPKYDPLGILGENRALNP